MASPEAKPNAGAGLLVTHQKGERDANRLRPRDSMEKCIWTLTGVPNGDRPELSRQLLEELPKAVRKLLPSACEAHVTIQEPTEYSGALVEIQGAPQRIDGVIEVLSSEICPPLDEFHGYLRDHWTHAQGWRVKPTLIYDSSQPRALGEPSTSPTNFIFVERMDGTTPEHFDRNWYIHAGHSDGREAESEASLAERHREEAEAPDRLYRQNRVIEPITPTAWVLHGYTQLQLGFFVPELGADAYPRVRGEEPFDRWPPRIFQGFEYRVL